MNDPTLLYHLLFVYPLEDFELLEGKNNVFFDLIVSRTGPAGVLLRKMLNTGMNEVPDGF